MNERIRLLAKNYLMYERFSRYGEWTEEEYYDFLPEELEEFVQLIVRECAKIVEDSTWNLPHGYKAVDQAELVKKHFGVAE